MRSRFIEPSARQVGGLFAAAVAFLLLSALILNLTEFTAYGYLSILVGLILLFVGLAQFAMRKLNLKYGRPEA